MDESHLDHSGVVERGLFKAGEDSSALLQPADQPFNDVAIPIGVSIKCDLPCRAIFIGLRGNHRLNVQTQELSINPVSPIAFVTDEYVGPGDRSIVQINNAGLCRRQQCREGLSFMHLSGRQFKRQRMTVIVARQMDLRGKAASGTTKGMVFRFLWVPLFPPPPAQRAARTMVPSTCQTLVSMSPASTNVAWRR